jgi:hypothetical protein
MKANKTHISLETAKLLKDCGVKSEWWSVVDTITEERKIIPSPSSKYYGIETDYYCCGKGEESRLEGKGIWDIYTWQEILWENAEKFFGKENHYNVTINNLIDKNGFDYIATQILILLQQKKYDEADKYFRENCKLIKI